VVTRYLVDPDVMVWAPGISASGRHIVGSRSGTTASLRVVPSSGGSPVVLTRPSKGYDWPLGWTADGSEVVAYTQIAGRATIIVAPAAGGTPRTYDLPAGATLAKSGVAGNHVSYTLPAPGSQRGPMYALDVSTGRSQQISPEVVTASMPVTGPGGVEAAIGNEFLHWVPTSGRVELRAAAPGGASRLIRSFPASIIGETNFAVHGNRVAYCETRGDSTMLMLAEGTTAEPRPLARLTPRTLQMSVNCRRTFSWSRDGRWLITDEYDGNKSPFRLVDTAPGGTSRIIDPGELWLMGAQWVPDNGSFVALAEEMSGTRTNLFLMSVDPDRPIVNVAPSEVSPMWGFVLSPDGRQVAYPAEQQGEDELILFELPAPLPGTRAP
jgi:hypothetical protein